VSAGDSAPAAEDGWRDAGLEGIREEIERIDHALLGLIAERVELARRVGAAKRAAGLPILDPAREAAVVRRAGTLAREAGLPDDDVRYIWWHLIGLSRRVQMEE
jgi:chorismate mutase